MLTRTVFSFAFLLVTVVLISPLSHAARPGYRAPEQVAGATMVTAEKVKALYDAGVPIVDVRNPRLYARRHIPDAHHLDLKDAYTEKSLSGVAKKDEPLVIYCSGVKCNRSSRASERAVTWGYSKVKYFRGGIVEWRDAGYPVEASEP